jgi:hypothetical protein
MLSSTTHTFTVVSIQNPGPDPDVKGLMMNSIKRQVMWQNLDTNRQERTGYQVKSPFLM